jgi:hypothetical protein
MWFSELISISLFARFPEGSSSTGGVLAFCVLGALLIAGCLAVALKTGKAGYTNDPTTAQRQSRPYPESHLVTRKHDPWVFWARIGIGFAMLIFFLVMAALVLTE